MKLSVPKNFQSRPWNTIFSPDRHPVSKLTRRTYGLYRVYVPPVGDILSLPLYQWMSIIPVNLTRSKIITKLSLFRGSPLRSLEP